MSTGIVRGIADVVCFGGFFALGVSGHHLRYRLSRSRRWVRRVLRCRRRGGGVRRATDRHGGQQLLRAARPRRPAWLLVMLALEDQLRHLGEIAAIRGFVGWIAGNSMSIYLWHTLALVFAYYIVGAPNSPGQYVILTAVFVTLIASMVPAVRPLESLGSRGRRVFRVAGRPDRAPVLGLALVARQPTLFPARPRCSARRHRPAARSAAGRAPARRPRDRRRDGTAGPKRC